LDRINKINTSATSSSFNKSQSNKSNTDSDTNSSIEKTKNTASVARDSINQQRAQQNQVYYDFSHFNDDDSSIKGVRFLA